ncbi:MAG: adenosine deaminase [Clostridia bacterium]|nr:adenosine deaminase [Lachnospiraceae bacterium]NCC01465.1 adenosine deaminase [Clostridia bacterium]NCD02129.1 adenosine deaminase [Clostridia bacterium]
MIDLHVHLSGSLRPTTIINYAREKRISLPTYDAALLGEYLKAPEHCQNLNEFYDLCDMTDWVLQDRRAIRQSMMELVQDLDSQGILYAEVRFSPSECTLDGLRQGDAVTAALEGLEWGMKNSRNIRVNLILCIIQKMNEHEAFETLVEVKKHLRKGVCGLDLLLDESLYETDIYDWLFSLIKEEYIPFTVHAGQYNTQSIKKAIRNGAQRISQSIHILDDEELLEDIIRRKVVVELCPSSNVKLGVVESYSTHPVRQLFDRGVRVCLGADRLRVSGATLQEEYDNLQKYLGFTPAEIYKMNQNAAKGAFLSQMEKDRLQFDLFEANKAIVDKE